MAEVFISHHVGTAEKTVREIAEKLKQQYDIECWYCERDEKGGYNYLAEIAKAIKSCKVFLLVLNRPAIVSPIINQEIHLMVERIQQGQEITRLQYRLEECTPTDAMDLIFAGIHYMNGTTDEVVERIGEILGKPIALQMSVQQSQPQLNFQPIPGNENLKWAFQDGTLYIAGTGRLQSWNSSKPPLRNLRYDITFLWIQDGVTSIGADAFRACSNLTDVIIPESMTWIGLYAFWGCEKLKSVKVPHHTIVYDNSFPASTKIIRY